jgi:hypothetical protein
MMKALFALATLVVIATPALAKDKVRADIQQQPTRKWCETESTDDNLAPDIWQTFKRGNCKTGEAAQDRQWIMATSRRARLPWRPSPRADGEGLP